MPKSQLEDPYRDELKLPILDSYLTRYVYYSFYRWGVRLG